MHLHRTEELAQPAKIIQSIYGQSKSIMSGVVALDTFDPEGFKYMRQLFPDVIEQGHPLHATWPEHAVSLFVAKIKVTAEMIRETKKLKFIIRHGAGYDNIDAEACREKGAVLCNLPGISVGSFYLPSYIKPAYDIQAMSVAEVVLSLTCACAKNLVELSRRMRRCDRPNKKCKSLYPAHLLTGKTFGIVGGGQIGQLTAKKL
jgi:D-3-phosphoglycerate dehydrogenase / 2-oxoglutarate reductase